MRRWSFFFLWCVVGGKNSTPDYELLMIYLVVASPPRNTCFLWYRQMILCLSKVREYCISNPPNFTFALFSCPALVLQTHHFQFFTSFPVVGTGNCISAQVHNPNFLNLPFHAFSSYLLVKEPLHWLLLLQIKNVQLASYHQEEEKSINEDTSDKLKTQSPPNELTM